MTTSTLTESPTENLLLMDLEMLQGTWISVSGRREAILLFAGQHFTVKFMDGDLYMGTYALSPGRRPKIMEMTIEEGPGHHLGKLVRCLYDLATDALRWCAPEPGSTERLDCFPLSQDRHYLSMMFRRELPQLRD